jgi:hypothetical protein
MWGTIHERGWMSGTERGTAAHLETVAPGDWGYVVTADGRVVRVRRVGDRLLADDGSLMTGPAAPPGSERAA